MTSRARGDWWFPTLATERKRKDGARSSCGESASFEAGPSAPLKSAAIRNAVSFMLLNILICAGALTVQAQADVPEWCRKLPRAEFAKLERVAVDDGWFEVYRVAPRVLAIYEPHQSEETIGYLILGR